MTNSHILQKIKDYYPNMTKAQKRIADYIISNPTNVVKNSITVLADEAGVKSDASIVRFYRTLGFPGFIDFKINLAQELVGQTFYHNYDDININDSPNEIKNKIFSGAISTLNANAQSQDEHEYEDASRLILKAGRIIFLGYAASAAMCYYAYFRFTELGFNCHFTPDPHISAAILAKPNPGDLVFCISHSGETRDIITPLEKVAHKDISIILITGSKNSTLVKMADVVLLTKADEKNIITDAMNSRIAELCTIDALFSIVSIEKGPEAVSRLLTTRETFYKYKK